MYGYVFVVVVSNEHHSTYHFSSFSPEVHAGEQVGQTIFGHDSQVRTIEVSKFATVQQQTKPPRRIQSGR